MAGTAHAQEDPRAVQTSAAGIGLRLSGTFQPQLSTGDDRAGFGIRRARLRATATLTRRLGVHYDLDAASGSARTVDLYGFAQLSDRVRLRAGYLAGPQPRSAAFTSHTRLDAVDRAAIAERWSLGTLGPAGRDFGVELRHQTERTTAELWVHNGEGVFPLGNVRTSSARPPGGDAPTRGLALSTYLSVQAGSGVEAGAFAGVNRARSPTTTAPGDSLGRDYASAAGHLYWGADPGSRPVRLKADLLAIRYDGGARLADRLAVGGSVLAAVQVARTGEAFARAERFRPAGDGPSDTYLTAGASYSLSARRGLAYRQERVTLAYTAVLSAADVPVRHLIVLQGQLVF